MFKKTCFKMLFKILEIIGIISFLAGIIFMLPCYLIIYLIDTLEKKYAWNAKN